MLRHCSSFQPSAPGSLTSWAPVVVPACQIPTKAPSGSMRKAILPASMTSSTGMATCPPASVAFATVASASSTARYVLQTGGCCSFCSGPMPATILPSSMNIP